MPGSKCRDCGSELPLNARFCPSCGVEVDPENRPAVEKEHQERTEGTIQCRNCGTENNAGLAYCKSCGIKLSPAGRKRGDAGPQLGPKSSRKGKPRGKIESWHIASMLGIVSVILVIFYFAERDNRDPAALLQQANELHDSRKFSEAIGVYKKYLDVNPNNVDARVDLGICYFELGDFQAARAEMEKGLTINPKHQLAYYNLGIVSMQERNIEQARRWFEHTIAIDSTTEIAKRSRMMIQQHSFPMKNK
jgi:tetratricopeptide (TPR) repeat protein